MNKKKLLLFIIGFILILSIISIGANADEPEKNPLRAFAKAFGGLNLGQTYNEFPYFFDGVFLAIIFVSLALMTLGKRFTGRPGKTLSVTVGIAMAVAFEAWNATVAEGGYTLRALGPYAALILMIIAGIGLIKYKKWARKLTIYSSFAGIAALVWGVIRVGRVSFGVIPLALFVWLILYFNKKEVVKVFS